MYQDERLYQNQYYQPFEAPTPQSVDDRYFRARYEREHALALQAQYQQVPPQVLLTRKGTIPSRRESFEEKDQRLYQQRGVSTGAMDLLERNALDFEPQSDVSKMLPVEHDSSKRSFKERRSYVNINSAYRDKTRYPNPNDYVMPLPRTFVNVKRVNLVSTEFTNTETTIRALPASEANNTFRWQNQYTGEPVFAVTLDAGNYTSDDLKAELLTKLNAVPHHTGQPHEFEATLNAAANDFSLTQFVTFTNCRFSGWYQGRTREASKGAAFLYLSRRFFKESEMKNQVVQVTVSGATSPVLSVPSSTFNGTFPARFVETHHVMNVDVFEVFFEDVDLLTMQPSPYPPSPYVSGDARVFDSVPRDLLWEQTDQFWATESTVRVQLLFQVFHTDADSVCQNLGFQNQTSLLPSNVVFKNKVASPDAVNIKDVFSTETLTYPGHTAYRINNPNQTAIKTFDDHSFATGVKVGITVQEESFHYRPYRDLYYVQTTLGLKQETMVRYFLQIFPGMNPEHVIMEINPDLQMNYFECVPLQVNPSFFGARRMYLGNIIQTHFDHANARFEIWWWDNNPYTGAMYTAATLPATPDKKHICYFGKTYLPQADCYVHPERTVGLVDGYFDGFSFEMIELMNLSFYWREDSTHWSSIWRDLPDLQEIRLRYHEDEHKFYFVKVVNDEVEWQLDIETELTFDLASRIVMLYKPFMRITDWDGAPYLIHTTLSRTFGTSDPTAEWFTTTQPVGVEPPDIYYTTPLRWVVPRAGVTNTTVGRTIYFVERGEGFLDYHPIYYGGRESWVYAKWNPAFAIKPPDYRFYYTNPVSKAVTEYVNRTDYRTYLLDMKRWLPQPGEEIYHLENSFFAYALEWFVPTTPTSEPSTRKLWYIYYASEQPNDFYAATALPVPLNWQFVVQRVDLSGYDDMYVIGDYVYLDADGTQRYDLVAPNRKAYGYAGAKPPGDPQYSMTRVFANKPQYALEDFLSEREVFRLVNGVPSAVPLEDDFVWQNDNDELKDLVLPNRYSTNRALTRLYFDPADYATPDDDWPWLEQFPAFGYTPVNGARPNLLALRRDMYRVFTNLPLIVVNTISGDQFFSSRCLHGRRFTGWQHHVPLVPWSIHHYQGYAVQKYDSTTLTINTRTPTSWIWTGVLHLNEVNYPLRVDYPTIALLVNTGFIQLQAISHLLLCNDLLATIKDNGPVNNIMAKIQLSGDQGALLFNSFITNPAVFEDSFPTVSELRFQLFRSTGSLAEVSLVDHSFTLDVVEHLDTVPSNGFDSRRGAITDATFKYRV